MSRPDEIWINATAVMHDSKKYARVESGGFGETTKSKVRSEAKFKGDGVSFGKAAVGLTAAHSRGPRKNPYLTVEVNVDSFKFQGLPGQRHPLLAIKKVLAKLESQDTLNFNRSGFKQLKIFNHLVNIRYKSAGEFRGGFLGLSKLPAFPFPFPSNSNGNEEETIVESLSFKSPRAEEDLKAKGIEVAFDGNRIDVTRAGKKVEIKLGIVRDLRPTQAGGQPPTSNGRHLGRLTMCEIQTLFGHHDGEIAAVLDGAALAASDEGEVEGDGNTTTVGDVRSDSVGT